jgi:hypothetical protein
VAARFRLSSIVAAGYHHIWITEMVDGKRSKNLRVKKYESFGSCVLGWCDVKALY